MPGTGCRCGPVPPGTVPVCTLRRRVARWAAMRRAQGDGNCGSSFSPSCQDWRDVNHRCQASTTGLLDRCYTGRHCTVLHDSYCLRREGTTIDITAGWATRTGHTTYVLSRWLFIRLLGVVYFVAFVSLTLQITGLVGDHGILPAGGFLERAHAAYGSGAYRLFPTLCCLGAGDGMVRALR